MSAILSCSCGAKLRIADDASRPIICPKCAAVVPEARPAQTLPRLRSNVAILWFMLSIWSVIACILYFSNMTKANSAIQQSAIAADACVYLIGPYILVRSLEKCSRRQD